VVAAIFVAVTVLEPEQQAEKQFATEAEPIGVKATCSEAA
jgi:hypothetical protein